MRRIVPPIFMLLSLSLAACDGPVIMEGGVPPDFGVKHPAPDMAHADQMPPDLACTKRPVYRDADGDGYGDQPGMPSCMIPPGYADKDGDCDDTNNAVHPNAPELCNHADDNCNGLLDEGIPMQTFYRDADNDIWGTNADIRVDCAPPAGYVILPGDCNDNNRDIHPKATELCNNVDDDCDGVIDNNTKKLDFYPDRDGDGWATLVLGQRVQTCGNPPPGYVAPRDANGDGVFDTDCDDDNVTIYPGAPEICGDNKVNNCLAPVNTPPDQLCFSTTPGNWPFKLTFSDSVTNVSAVDLDGDEHHEIIVQDGFGFAVLDWQGKPIYQYSAPVYNYSRGNAVVADIDDGNQFGPGIQTLEILTGNGSVPHFYKLNNGAIKEFVNAKESVYDASRFMARDIDGDGTPEFFTATWCDPNRAVAMYRFDRSNGAINFVKAIPELVRGACGYASNGRTISDLDGDGRPEILFGSGYPVPTDPTLWEGHIQAHAFTNPSTLDYTPYCQNCFKTDLPPMMPMGPFTASVPGIVRVGNEVRVDALAFLGKPGPAVSNYFVFGLDGATLAGPLPPSGTWAKTTDIDRDGVPEDYGSFLTRMGLFDVNGDTFPDRIYASGNELRVDLWNPKRKVFEENVASRFRVSPQGTTLTAFAAWDLNLDGRIDVLSADSLGNVYSHSLGAASFSKDDWLPSRFPAFETTFQFNGNEEPNPGFDRNYDGLPDLEFVRRIPSALTAKGDFRAYLDSSLDKDFFLIDTHWSGSICLQAPPSPTQGAAVAYKLRVYSFSDRLVNANGTAGTDGKPDGLVWEGVAQAGKSVCFSGGGVNPARNGEFKFIIGVESANGLANPYWPYSILARK